MRDSLKYFLTPLLLAATPVFFGGVVYAENVASPPVPPSAVVAPRIRVTIAANPMTLSAKGGSAGYDVTVYNPGTVTLSDVIVQTDACAPVKYVSGDANGDHLLDPAEAWSYSCRAQVDVRTVNRVNAYGSANGITVIDSASVIVDVPTAQDRRYGVAQALASAPTINANRSIFEPSPGSAPVSCVDKSLLKLISDGDARTQHDSAVYYCGADDKRYVFVTNGTYLSWYPDYAGVREVSTASLSGTPLGGNVTYRPGSRLLRIESDDRTYVVSRGGVLRWVTDEAVARALYGDDWHLFVEEISISLFNSGYAFGEPVTMDDVIFGPVPALPGTPPPSTVANASACRMTPGITVDLAFGDRNPQVLALQQLLQCLGFFPAGTEPNGYFGEATRASVKAFQSAHAIDPVGYVGPATRDAVNVYASR